MTTKNVQTKDNKKQVTTVSTDNVQQQTDTPLNYFYNLIKSKGYTIKTYNALAECTVQNNGKVQIYFVPLKRNNGLKLCLKGVQGLNIEGLQYQVLNTYPSNYTHRLYLNLFTPQTKQIIDTVVQNFTPITKG